MSDLKSGPHATGGNIARHAFTPASAISATSYIDPMGTTVTMVLPQVAFCSTILAILFTLMGVALPLLTVLTPTLVYWAVPASLGLIAGICAAITFILNRL